MKTLPNLTLFFPSAGDQVATAMDRMDQSTSPTYLRLAISPFATARKPLAENPKTLTRRFHQGSEVTVIGVGHAVQIALTALEKAGCGDWPVDIFGITQYPFDLKSDEWLIDSVRKTGRVVVVEEHYRAGGIGESLKAALPPANVFVIMSAAYAKEPLYGSSRFHHQQCNLTPEQLGRHVADLLKSN